MAAFPLHSFKIPILHSISFVETVFLFFFILPINDSFQCRISGDERRRLLLVPCTVNRHYLVVLRHSLHVSLDYLSPVVSKIFNMFLWLAISRGFAPKSLPLFSPLIPLWNFRPRELLFCLPLPILARSMYEKLSSAAAVAKLLRSERSSELLAQFLVQPHAQFTRGYGPLT